MSDKVELLVERQVLLKERDEARAAWEELNSLYQLANEQRLTLSREAVRLELERDDAYTLLRDCHWAVLCACFSEEGLDVSEGVPLVERIEALFPDLAAKRKAMEENA